MSDSTKPTKKPTQPKWRLCRDGVEYGPFTSQQLQAMATAGELCTTDFLWKQGMTDWVLANTTSLVFPSEAAAVDLAPASSTASKPESETLADPNLADFVAGRNRSQFDFLSLAGSDETNQQGECAFPSTVPENALDDAPRTVESPFSAAEDEQILYRGGCSWMEGITTHLGTIVFTTRYLSFCQPSGFDLGLMVIHTIRLLTQAHDQIIWRIALPDIVAVTRKKHLGFGRKTVVTARDGTKYTLIVDGDAWRNAWQSSGLRLIDSTGDAAVRRPQHVVIQCADAHAELEDGSAQEGLETTSEAEWHVSARGTNYGPIGFSELQRMCQAGEVTAGDLVWKEGMEKWVLASSVPGLGAVRQKPKGPPRITEVEAPKSSTTFESFVVDTARTACTSATRLSHAQPVKGFHVQRIVVGIASTVGILSTFLPWARLPIVGTIDGTFNGDGWITLGLYAAVVVCVFREPHGKMFAGSQKLVAGICPLLAALVGFCTFYNIGSARRALDDDNPFGAAIKGSLRAGIGLYLIVICGLVAAVAVFALPEDKRGVRYR